jgi:hypothetical protein
MMSAFDLTMVIEVEAVRKLVAPTARTVVVMGSTRSDAIGCKQMNAGEAGGTQPGGGGIVALPLPSATVQLPDVVKSPIQTVSPGMKPVALAPMKKKLGTTGCVMLTDGVAAATVSAVDASVLADRFWSLSSLLSPLLACDCFVARMV